MRYRFDGHVLDAERRELRREDEAIAVEPQVFDLLLHLLRHRDRVVSRDELIAAVWAGRIVSDSTLDSRINAARRAVGDSGAEQRLVRTFARRGVRFVGEVVEETGAPAAAASPADRLRKGRPCLAVLPFANLSGDPGQEYFSDGITEDIITLLSRNRSLLVIARNSSFAFRGGGDVRRIGRALGADYLVEGSVRRSGPHVRVTAQLAETEAGRQLWGERYDRGLQDIFELQDEIAATIAARIEPEIGEAEQQRLARKPSQSFDAWDYFRLGTRRFHSATVEDNREAQALFRKAIALDPSLAQAHGYLSYAIVLSMLYFDAEPEAARLAEAVAIGRRGVALDERDALVRFTYGRALLASGAYDAALAELEIARGLNPALPVVHCGLADSLACEGRIREAIPHFDAAIALSPHDPLRWAFMCYRALAHIFAGEYEEAARWAWQATRMPNCHFLGYAHRVAALGHLAPGPEREAAVAELRERRPSFTRDYARQRLFYIRDVAHVARYLEGLARAGVP